MPFKLCYFNVDNIKSKKEDKKFYSNYIYAKIPTR